MKGINDLNYKYLYIIFMNYFNKLRSMPIWYLILFVKGILQYDIIQMFISFLLATWFNIYLLNPYDKNKHLKIMPLIFYILLYLLVIILFRWLNGIKREEEIKKAVDNRKHEDQLKSELLNSSTYILHRRSEDLVIESKGKSKEVLANTQLQNSLNLLCRSIYGFITSFYTTARVEVTIFQQFLDEDSNSFFVTPIAFGTQNDVLPNCFGKKYYLDDDDSSYYISKIFNRGKSDYVLLLDRAQVKKAFSYKNADSKNKEDICQYIAVPTRTISNVTTAVIQISFYDKVLTKKSAAKLINEHLRIYMKCYELFINEQQLVDVVYNNMEVTI